MTITTRHKSLSCLLTALALTTAIVTLRGAMRPVAQKTQAPQAIWTSSAHWHHGFRKSPGTLSITDAGVRFKALSGASLDWPFEEIQTFHLSPHELRLVGYQNRGWHLRGERSFTFRFQSLMPPGVAESLARLVGKPSENGIPDSNAPAFATLPARHRTRGGGTNGVLRFSQSGIEYVTTSGRGARSWRWADIDTIACPDPYHFRVSAYREIFSFELKASMSDELFGKLWSHVYTRDLSGLNLNGGKRP